MDDARSHLSTLKMLRNFHYVDDKGKDQGINGTNSPQCNADPIVERFSVRNRAKEIAELLSNLDLVRQERRKAKVNRNKYTGTGNDGGSYSGGFGNSGSMYLSVRVVLIVMFGSQADMVASPAMITMVAAAAAARTLEVHIQEAVVVEVLEEVRIQVARSQD